MGQSESEPLFILWELISVVLTIRAGRYNTVTSGVALGLALGVSILTRHVGVCLAAACRS